MKTHGIEIIGTSTSGIATVLSLPQFDITFDIGVMTEAAIKTGTVAITHGHLDHLGALAQLINTRHMIGAGSTRVIVPAHLEDAVHELIGFWAKVQNQDAPEFELWVLNPGERVDIGGKRFLRSFKTDHRIESQGFVLGEDKKSLKPEFRGRPGRELGALRQQGVVLEDVSENILFAFTGDTRASIFEDANHIALKAQVLVTECTFLDDITVEEAQRKGHIHIDQIRSLAERGRFENVGAVLLTHFSRRCSAEDVATLNTTIGATFPNVSALPIGGF